MKSKEMIKNKIDMLITALYINGDTDIETIDKIKDELNMYKNIEKDLERLEQYEKYIPQLIEGHKKLQSAEDWGDIADSAFLIRTALEKIGVIEED